ncbi:MAG: magnesium transporter [Desulfobacterales bacterium]|nr:magnesium transporter [Desulfobacterales bacterium]
MIPPSGDILAKTIKRLLRRRSFRHLRKIANRAQPVDLARTFAALTLNEQLNLYDLINAPAARGTLLAKLDPNDLQPFAAAIPLDELITVSEQIPADDLADLVEQLPPEIARQVLEGLQKESSEEVGDLLQYDRKSAGGIMATDFLALPERTTVREAIQRIQQEHQNVETTFYLYVTGEHQRLRGVCSLRELVMARADTVLSAIMTRETFSVSTDTDQEEVARIVSRYDLLAVPVVDADQRVVGIVTVDDVIDIIRDEATEDILKMAGAGQDFVETKSIFSSIRIRLPWLLATCGGGVAATLIIGHFESTLEQLIFLAAFIPVIMGMGGNIGTQSATIVVRGLATESIQIHRLGHVLVKETAVGFLLGFIYGVLLGAVAHIGYQMWQLGLLVALAVVFTMTMAAVVGALLPMTFARFKIDPAVATGPFVTTSIDILSISFYFYLARWLFRI